ncbi:MAG TPA: hypothetical protein VH275_04925 [Solirubrobacterales bacterium]|jgi:hypothetical protein|nr:hypothetical protein [Solirubrobacterales bacterium]
MSILDDAIREHLELKRAHGADDSELKKLEDEAFGPPQRPDEPDPFAEAPTEFLIAPEVGAGEQTDEPGERRAPNIADLQEAPEPAEAPRAEEPDDGPAEEEHPAMEHETIPDPGHSTEERHAIAEQPTELFDVEGQFEDAATESDAPSDDELIDAEMAEPRLAPVDPLAGIEASAGTESEAPAEPAAADEDEPADEFDEFFSEQRLSDELNQALEAPLPDEPGAPPTEETPAVFIDLDDEEDAAGGVAFEDDEPAEDPAGEPETATPEAPPEPEDDAPPPAAPAPGSSHEDVLEDTPEFLEDAPEDDNLWFEQKPPKDFDFDD